jgi:hypothetical protein
MDESATVQDSSYINDIRNATEFKGISFSKYKKGEVRNALIESMLKGKIEPACYWCAELVCAGHYLEIWEILLFYIGKHIHLGNPKIAIYLEQRYELFRNIIENAVYAYELQLRNRTDIRKLFAELICVFVKSPRKHCLEPLKINGNEDFNMANLADKLKAPDTNCMDEIFHKEDPKEYFIAVNELAYHIAQKGGAMMACYWIEWILEFETYCKKRGDNSLCFRRKHVPVHSSYQKDVIWIVWDTLKHSVTKHNKGAFIEKTMDSLFRLFCIKYSSPASRKRRHILYYAVGLLTELVPTHIPLIEDKKVVENVLSQINEIYKEVKKKEESPQTDYLFESVDMERDNSNIEKSMKKLEMLYNVGVK